MRIVLIYLCCSLAVVACGQNFGNLNYSTSPLDAKVAPYTVKSDLSNVANRKILPKLSKEQVSALTAHGFVARPTAEEQLFYIYENNAYQNIGSFITTDSVLHTYHIFYDFSLRYLEKERLFPAVKELSALMLNANLKALQGQHDAAIADALNHNAVYFAVPLVLLDAPPTLPAAISAQVDAEVTRINAHEKRDDCITGAEIDYTQFIPRGHYTRTEEFQRYFRAMMWYGLVPMNLNKRDRKLDKPSILQALIITEQLRQSPHGLALWQQLYDPTVFYVGKADDLSYYQFGSLLDQVFGNGEIDRFDDDAKLAKFAEQVKKLLPGPGIVNVSAEGPQGKQFRFMGQRFIPDSRMLQELTMPKVGTDDNWRYFPLGLDVFAVLGNTRAASLLDNKYQQTQYANYLSQRKKLQAEIQALTLKDWQQNLYYGWMYCLLPILQPHGAGYPSFMTNRAWQDKSLLTALGSWTELRHDTILYAKQSSVAECGDSDDQSPPPAPGYVEPEVGVFERLSWLLKLNKAGLQQRHLLGPHDQLGASFDQFIELTAFLASTSRKELRNVALSGDEQLSLHLYGGTLESLMLAVVSLGQDIPSSSWWDIESKTDRDMALVADVHTANAEVLEEAVGHAAEMWVVVPIKGKLRLTRGAIYSYYEFTHPSQDRLTDEAWQAQINKGAAPSMPDWVHSFMLAPGRKATPNEGMGDSHTGC